MPGGGESSGSSQSSGYGSSYSQSASLSKPVNLNPTTGMLPGTMQALQGIDAMLQGGPGSNSMLQAFLAPYGGNFSAPVTGAQQNTLNDLGMAEGGNFSFDPSLQALVNQLTNEGSNPIGFGQQVAQGLGLGSNPVQAGQALASGLAGPGAPTVGAAQFAEGLANNPETQQIINEVTAPITAAFNTQTVPGLQGSFAQAGQRGSGMGSSAFGMSFGNAQAQEEANLAAASGNVANTTYQNALQAYENEYAAGSGMYANAYNGGVNAGIAAPSQYQSLTSGSLSNLINTLNAQALPQLTEQLGINNALSTYNNSISSLLQALGLQTQGEQPSIGYESEQASNSASFQNEQSSGQNSSFQFQI